MTKEQKLLKLYTKKGVIIDNEEIIILKEFCLAYIQSCKKSQLIILGIDGYIIEDTSIKVNLTEIVDFSKTEKNLQNCYNLAENFIRGMLNNGTSDGYIFTLSESSTL